MLVSVYVWLKLSKEQPHLLLDGREGQKLPKVTLLNGP